MIIVNFKNYIFGKRALELARVIEKNLGRNSAVAVSAFDLGYLKDKVNLEVYAQHVDAVSLGRHTGFLSVSGAKDNGAKGSLLNHSEHPLYFEDIKKTLSEAHREKLKMIVCVPDLAFAEKIVSLKPWGIAYEDPELVGSGKSVTNYRQEEVVKFVKFLGKRGIKKICGAGISNAEDVSVAKKLGCDGVLISSAIANVKIAQAEKLLRDIKKTNF